MRDLRRVTTRFRGGARGRAWILALAVLGCGPVQVIQRSEPPSALAGERAMTVHHDWSRLQVKGGACTRPTTPLEPEAVYTAEMTDALRDEYARSKAALAEALVTAMRAAAPGIAFTVLEARSAAGVHLEIRHESLQVGWFGLCQAPTGISSRFTWTRDGRATDVIVVTGGGPSSTRTLVDLPGMSAAGQQLGATAGAYLLQVRGGS